MKLIPCKNNVNLIKHWQINKRFNSIILKALLHAEILHIPFLLEHFDSAQEKVYIEIILKITLHSK